MSDLISRQAAIDAMKSISDSICEQQAIDALCELPSAQQWIPCSERLPEEGKEVLISTNGSIYISAYDMLDGLPYWYDTVEYITIMEVDAWMPLPEPYKGEDHG